MLNILTYDDYRDPDFLVWAQTGKAVELVWTGNIGILAVYQLIKAKAKYKKFVRLEWV